MSEGNMVELGINVEEESKNMQSYDALPEGEYDVVITTAELKKNKDNEGQHIGATMQVIEGEFEGRLIFANYNVSNANPTAEKIGRAELAACCLAVGVTNPKDTADLVDKPFRVKVGIDRKDATKNKIKAYMPLDNKPAPAPTKPAPAPTPTAGGSKPWQKRK